MTQVTPFYVTYGFKLRALFEEYDIEELKQRLDGRKVLGLKLWLDALA